MALRQEARSGAIWLVGSSFVNMGVAFGLAILLARILEVSAFGLMTLSTITCNLAFVLVVGVFRDTVILRQDLDDDAVSSLFWLSVVVAIVVGLGIVAIAVPAARFMQAPDLAPILYVTAGSVVSAGIGAVPNAIRIVRKDFARIGYQTAVLSIGLAPITVVLAYSGAGPISAVVTGFAFYLLSTLIAFKQCGWWPKAPRNLKAANQARSTALVVLGQQSLDVANSQVDRGFVASMLGTHDLGLFSVGRRLNDLMLDAIVNPALGVALPLISSMQGDVERLKSVYLRTLSMATLLAVSANLGLFVVGDLVVLTLFGEKWAGVTPVLQAFTLMGVISAVTTVQAAVIRGGGQPGTWLRLQILGTVVNVVVIALAAPHGLTVLAYALVMRNWVLSPLAFLAASRMLRVSVADHWKVLWPPVTAGLVMVVVLFLARHSLPSGLLPVVELAILIPIGAAVYLGMVAILAPTEFREAASFIFNR